MPCLYLLPLDVLLLRFGRFSDCCAVQGRSTVPPPFRRRMHFLPSCACIFGLVSLKPVSLKPVSIKPVCVPPPALSFRPEVLTEAPFFLVSLPVWCPSAFCFSSIKRISPSRGLSRTPSKSSCPRPLSVCQGVSCYCWWCFFLRDPPPRWPWRAARVSCSSCEPRERTSGFGIGALLVSCLPPVTSKHLV